MRKNVKLSLAGGMVAATVMAVTLPQSASDCHWQSQSDVQAVTSIYIKIDDPQCASDVTEVSWYSWLAGKSASYQFHFLDLLELLYSNDSRRGNLASPAN